MYNNRNKVKHIPMTFTPTKQRNRNSTPRKGALSAKPVQVLGPATQHKVLRVNDVTKVVIDTNQEMGGAHHSAESRKDCDMASTTGDTPPAPLGCHKRKRDICPLCDTRGAGVEHAGATTGNHQIMRQIMAQELTSFGMIPDNVIYTNIAREYNRRVFEPTRAAGFGGARWTPRIVKTHFEQHVRFVPRRVVGRDIELCDRMLRTVKRELVEQETVGGGGDELLEPKTLSKAIALMKMKQSLLKDLRAYVKEDMVSSGCSVVDAAGPECGVSDAREVLLRLHATATGVAADSGAVFAAGVAPNADLPVGAELFA
jgi:hypothetical protein